MARAYVEFVQSQWLPWEPAPAEFGGAEWKRLSHDPDDGACTVLLRWRAGRAKLAHQALQPPGGRRRRVAQQQRRAARVVGMRGRHATQVHLAFIQRDERALDA